ncbi:MAG: DUF839 domain-containing protein [Microscillaceae bacterium]|nr:DUF839 domain-containing protein [Microscillaceae bacterium]
MRRFLALLTGLVLVANIVNAQIFPESIAPGDYNNFVLPMPPSPLSQQILFIGGVDLVQTTETYGNPAGQTVAKQNHDFIGFTPDTTGASLGWVSVNHEQVAANDKIGDGGGMTAFRVARSATGELVVIPQVLADGRAGDFFNVDFVNTVGETGMNCAGISSYDGRIWTAEEWFNYTTSDYYANGSGIRDTTDFTISSDIPGFDGLTINKIDNLNWMVEIDPREAKAIRKQYNWGRQGFEGGTITPDNKYVYLGEDGSPGLFTRFVAETPGDFTKGKLQYYAYDEVNEKAYWVDYPIDNFVQAVSMNSYNGAPFFPNTPSAAKAEAGLPWKGADAAVMFLRNEWVSYYDGKIYWTETGRDTFANEWASFTPRGGSRYVGNNYNGKIGKWHLDAARIRFPELNNISNDSLRTWLVANNANFRDVHGRVFVYDIATEQTYIFIEGGPFNNASASQELGGGYPDKHLTNPDGLNFITTPNGKTYMIISEDLNGRTWNRVPAGVNNSTCELWLYDMDKYVPGEVAKVSDLIRISTVPQGAEVTGAIQTPDGVSLLVNSQHPSSSNPFPFNNSLTYAINGFDKLAEANNIKVVSLTLYDADTQEPIAVLGNGDRIRLSNLATRELTIVAEVEGPVGSVVFNLSGAMTANRAENIRPYALFADDFNASGDLFGKSLAAGRYMITATPYTQIVGQGAAGLPITISFELIEGAPAPKAASATSTEQFTVNNVESTFTVDKGVALNAALYNMKGQKVAEFNNQTALRLESYRELGSVIVKYQIVESGKEGSIRIDFGNGIGAASTEEFESVLKK